MRIGIGVIVSCVAVGVPIGAHASPTITPPEVTKEAVRPPPLAAQIQNLWSLIQLLYQGVKELEAEVAALEGSEPKPPPPGDVDAQQDYPILVAKWQAKLDKVRLQLSSIGAKLDSAVEELKELVKQVEAAKKKSEVPTQFVAQLKRAARLHASVSRTFKRTRRAATRLRKSTTAKLRVSPP
jgi:DNA repair exonuclease SbcCD ATPase subunit